MRTKPARFWLKAPMIQAVLDRNHLAHLDFAQNIGISRGYLSQLMNRKRALSPFLRQRLLTSRYLRGIEAVDLWDIEQAA